MNKRNHLILGAILAVTFIIILGWLGLNWITLNFLSIINIGLILIFYSLLPDIDHKNSTITWWFFGIGILGLVIGMIEMTLKITNPNPYTILITSTLLLAFTFIATNFFHHRGIIHSVQVGLLAVIPIFFLFHNFIYCIFAYIAWHSHLIGDGYLFKIK